MAYSPKSHPHRRANQFDKESREISDNRLAEWLWDQYITLKKEYLRISNPKKREDLLFSVAKVLRQYVNCTRTKQGGIQLPFKKSAHSMVEWVQEEMYKAEWSPKIVLISGAVLFARRFTGNLAIEGTALRKPVSAAERRKLAAITRQAEKRFDSSLAELHSEDSDRLDDLRALSLVDDHPEMDQASSDGELHAGDNGTPETGISTEPTES